MLRGADIVVAARVSAQGSHDHEGYDDADRSTQPPRSGTVRIVRLEAVQPQGMPLASAGDGRTRRDRPGAALARSPLGAARSRAGGGRGDPRRSGSALAGRKGNAAHRFGRRIRNRGKSRRAARAVAGSGRPRRSGLGAHPPGERVMKTVLLMIETGGTGGAETVYVNIVRGLDQPRWWHVAVLPVREWMYEQLEASGVQPVLLRERGTFDVVYFARMLALIKERRVDLIHAHLFGSAVRAALLSRMSGVPAVATLHGNMDLGSKERLLNAKVGLLNRGLKRVVFVSEPLRRAVLGAVPLRADLAMVIPNGIDADRFASGDGPAFRAAFGIAADEFVVGTVATPGRAAKGLDIFLEMAALLKNRSPQIKFVIVGDLALGRGTELLKQRATLGLDRDVMVTGFRDDVANALAAFDVYALTSRTEGFSIALIEAMASGLPVVATRCGGPEQILSDGVTGLLVENESAPAIANAIERLRGSVDERRRLASAARTAVRERFSLDAQLRAYQQLYDEVLADRNGKEPSAMPEKFRATIFVVPKEPSPEELKPGGPARISVVIP